MMHIIYNFDELPEHPDGSVVTIGNFDGVHRGHQAILAHAQRLAKEHGLPLYVITFDPAPSKLLRPEHAPKLLTPLPIKKQLLARCGIERLIIVATTLSFLATPPRHFVRDILVKKLRVKHIVEGETFGFGQQRQAGIGDLQQWAAEFGFTSHLTPSLVVAGSEPAAQLRNHTVSSSLIRGFLAEHQYRLAYQCLGHPLWLAGQIVPGRGKARQLGFPTANIQLYTNDQLVPFDGVFAAAARLGDSFEQAWDQSVLHPTALSIGPCSTFTDGVWQIEAFLMDLLRLDEDLYGKHILCTIVEKMRAQEKFDSMEALSKAIDKDCRSIRDVLAQAGLETFR